MLHALFAKVACAIIFGVPSCNYVYFFTEVWQSNGRLNLKITFIFRTIKACDVRTHAHIFFTNRFLYLKPSTIEIMGQIAQK